MGTFQSYEEEWEDMFTKNEDDFKIEGKPSTLLKTIFKIPLNSYQ